MPRATKAMALTQSFKLMKQPRCPATSPMTAVQSPTAAMEMTKVGYPLKMPENFCKKLVKLSSTVMLGYECF